MQWERMGIDPPSHGIGFCTIAHSEQIVVEKWPYRRRWQKTHMQVEGLLIDYLTPQRLIIMFSMTTANRLPACLWVTRSFESSNKGGYLRIPHQGKLASCWSHKA